MDGGRGAERIETLIIGGGQAGLSLGYELAKRERAFLILDGNERIGDSWRKRWDSLRVFTPAKYDGLPGSPYPGPGWSFPTKDELADYFEAYADRFHLPVRNGVTVDGMARLGDGYAITAGAQRFEADHVVIATGACQSPKVPPFAGELDPDIAQMHSTEYKNPSQLRDGPVLLVGVGNSGAEIAYELARTRPVVLSGKEEGQIPVRHGSLPARVALPIIRFVGGHVLTTGNPIGRKVKPKLLSGGAPLIRVKRKDLEAAGVEGVPRTVGVESGKPVVEGGRVIDASNVIWCTGFRSNFDWLQLPIFDEAGRPIHDRGVVTGQPGLYFMGLVFQYAATSDVLPGVGRDAAYVAKQIDARQRKGRREAAPASTT